MAHTSSFLAKDVINSLNEGFVMPIKYSSRSFKMSSVVAIYLLMFADDVPSLIVTSV